MEQIISCYFYCTVLVCCIGLLDKIARLASVTRPPSSLPAVALIDAPDPAPFSKIAKKLLFGPARQFHGKSNWVWTVGYICYHIAIVLLVAGYAASAVILANRILSGVPVPDFLHPVPGHTNLAPGNLLAFIFGNAEEFSSNYLFGSYSHIFRAIAWVDLPVAIVGNGCLLYTVLTSRVGAVRHNIDHATRDLRAEGQFCGEHLAVRIVILSIIVTEFIGRLGWVPSIAYYHALLGLSLLAALPYTYLAHIPLSPVVAWLAFKRQKRGATA